MPRGDVERYLATVSLSAITDQTIVDRPVLERQIAEDRARGYALSTGERIPGGHGIGVPIFRADGECIGSILWSTPSSRWDRRREPEFAAAVRAAAAELSRRLGHSNAA
jgi:IclR family acetate operon transcriptional repressor